MAGESKNPQATVEQALQIALQHHQAGRLSQAEEFYRQILTRQPNHADALHLMGLVAHQTGKNQTAIELIRRAIVLRPDWPEAHHNLGVSLKAFANIQRDMRNWDAAIAAYHEFATLKPNDSVAFNSLGVALQNKGQLDDAVSAYHRAIGLNPRYAEAHANLGVALREKGKDDEAILAFRQSIVLKPDLPETHFNFGNALLAKGQLDESIASYRRAIALRPGYADAHNNLGNALIDTGELDEAIVSYRQAVTLDPGNSLFNSALACSLHYRPACDASTIADEHARWNRRHAEPLGRDIPPYLNHRNYDRPLRIGYVSRDFRQHPVGRFLLPLIENHDRGQFEVFCYSDVSRPDEMTARFKNYANSWREIVALTHADVAAQIRADEIDILVDLGGHTTGSRLLVFAQKPAPVQVSYLGYPGTTGLTVVDYRLTDGLADPEGLTNHLYSEKLLRLPRSNWCYSEQETAPIIPPPLLKQGYITFGSFNNFAKVTDSMLQMWGTILHRVPSARLLLKANAFVSTTARDRASRTLTSCGIDAGRFTLLGPQSDHATYLATYSQIDIALDTYPYHGTTTTCDALWMGVPVITLAGQLHVSRVGVSLLTNIGRPELIAETVDEYVNIAVALANDADHLTALRSSLRKRMKQSPLMDAPEFTRNVEAAYRQIWRQWCESGST